MMDFSENSINAIKILQNYTGDDEYILWLKEKVCVYKQLMSIGTFAADYILKNPTPKNIILNQLIKLDEGFALKQQKKWQTEFVPNKVVVSRIVGETDDMYGMFGKYRQSLPKDIFMLIPKNAIITQLNLPSSTDLVEVDFEKYNEISKASGIKLLKHQQDAIRFMVTRKKCILADGCGLGKTITTVVSALEGGYEKVLIICPASIKSTWKRELKYYVPETDISIVNGRTWDESRFTIINYDILHNFYTLAEEQSYHFENIPQANGTIIKQKILEWKEKPVYDENGKLIKEGVPKMKQSRKKDIVEEALKKSQLFLSKFDLVIIDECHRLSNNKSAIFKITTDLLSRLKPQGIFAITGTPMTNRPMNLYNILKLINHPITKDWQYYVKTYCEGNKIPLKGEFHKWLDVFLKKVHKKSFGELSANEQIQWTKFFEKMGRFIWQTGGASNLDDLRERIKDCYIRRVNTEIEGMVKKEIIVKDYDLNEKQYLDYILVWEEYKRTCKEKGVNPNEEYRMLTEGVMLRMYLSKQMLEHTIELAEEHLENGSKVLLLCNYDEELYALQKHFGNKCVIYNGKMNAKQKDESERAFMHDDNIKVFIGQTIACGVGLTLTAGNIAIFNSFSWVPADNQQAMDRVFRITQKEDVKVYFQLFNSTILVDMWDKVQGKESVISNVVVKRTFNNPRTKDSWV